MSALTIPTNTAGGELHFSDRERLEEFALAVSDRVSVTLEQLAKQIDDGMIAVQVESLADLAFQVRNAIHVLAGKEGGAA